MKRNKIPSLLCLSALGLALMLPSGCGIFSSPPEHAGHIPADAWMVATFYPSEIMEKAGFEEFMKSSIFDDMPKDASAALKVLSLDEPEKTGIDLDEPVYVFIAGNPEKGGSFGFTFLLDDGEAFADIIEDGLALIEAGGEKGFNQSSKDGANHVTHKDEDISLLYNDDKALFTFGENHPEKLFNEPNDPSDLPPVIQAHLERSFDLGAAIDFDNLASMAGTLRDDEAAIFSSSLGMIAGGGVALELSSDDGSIEVSGYTSYGEDNDMEDFAGDGVDSDLLDVIPDDAIAAATLSLNLENMVEKILPELAKSIPFPGFPEDGDFPIHGTKFTINDVVTAIPGDFSFSLSSIPTGREPPDFVIAIKTADDDSKEYEKVITDGFLEEAEGELKRKGISIKEKDNLLLIGTERSILREGEAEDPVSGHKEDILTEGYVGFCLDVEELIDALPFKRSDMREEEQLLLDGANKLKLLSMWAEESGDGYEATIEL
ncbi:MAG: DUF4836 family protein, partial [Opitutales bacterium]